VPPSRKPKKAANETNGLQGEVLAPGDDFFLELERQIDSFWDIDCFVSGFYDDVGRSELKLGLRVGAYPCEEELWRAQEFRGLR